MNDNTRFSSSSILNEILVGAYGREQKADLKTRGDHLVASTINLLDEIHGEYGDEIAGKLERRLISAIKQRDPTRFRFNKR